MARIEQIRYSNFRNSFAPSAMIPLISVISYSFYADM
jgi:hypothetical protein